MPNRITILGTSYDIIDSRDNIPLVDSFVMTNKLAEYHGHGEARLYVGAQQEGEILDFFEGLNEAYAIMLKADLRNFLDESKFEYLAPIQSYRPTRQSLADRYAAYLQAVSLLPDRLEFTFANATGADDLSRYYIRSEAAVWKLMRKIALSKISSLSILKLCEVGGDEFIYYFIISIDQNYNTDNHPSSVANMEDEVRADLSTNDRQKAIIIQARIGQGKFRDGVLEQIEACPITGVQDPRLLIASHIKPWRLSDNNEKVDPNNGIMLTPTYDKLFDLGLITFEDDCTMLISPLVSEDVRERLDLRPGVQYRFEVRGRLGYLLWHRQNRFRRL